MSREKIAKQPSLAVPSSVVAVAEERNVESTMPAARNLAITDLRVIIRKRPSAPCRFVEFNQRRLSRRIALAARSEAVRGD